MARIDDAVTRILRVKMRAGVFEQPKPSAREHAGEEAALLAPELARRAVRQSLVLLKNTGNVLPLAAGSRLLVVGKSADSMQNQTGGWTLTWQGTGNTNSDFPVGTTILGGLREAVGAANVTFSENADDVQPGDYDAVIAVIGETPYAEGVGDLGRRTLEAAQRFPEDLAVLERVTGRGTPVVTVLVTGRPLWVNKELNRSAAFVVAWLPGTEGGGVADLLVQGPRTGVGFTGRLTFSWPRSACQATVNVGDADYDPLFPYGYGLANGETGSVGELDETGPAGGCPDVATDGELELFVWGDFPPYRAFVGSADSATPLGNADVPLAHADITATASEVNVQLDARRIEWTGSGPAEFYLADRTGGSDLSDLDAAATAIVFDVIVHEPPAAEVVLRVDGAAGAATATVTEVLRRLPVGEKATVKVPLSSLQPAADLTRVSRPFAVQTGGAFSASFANIRWVLGAAHGDDAVSSDDRP
jgi:beta-glucosidase